MSPQTKRQIQSGSAKYKMESSTFGGVSGPSEKRQRQLERRDSYHSTMITKCKHCGTEHTFPDSVVGKLAQCKACGGSFIVKAPEPQLPPLKIRIPKQQPEHEAPTETRNDEMNEEPTPPFGEHPTSGNQNTSWDDDCATPSETDGSIESAPTTSSPDSSAVLLEGVGQVKITVGWLLCLLFVAIGGGLGNLPGAVFGFLFGLLFVWNGYVQGAKEKATAKAAINASKAAERTARMEQLLVNMVHQDPISPKETGLGPIGSSTVPCPKCGTQQIASSKFCPECGTALIRNCNSCGTSLSVSAKYCPECGARQQL